MSLESGNLGITSISIGAPVDYYGFRIPTPVGSNIISAPGSINRQNSSIHSFL